MPQTTFVERMNEMLGGRSKNAFARLAGIPEATFRSYFEGSMPSLDKAAVIAELGEVSLLWLATGQGPKQTGPALPVSEGDVPEGFVPVPRLDIRPSAGPGALAVYDESEGDVVAFREAWLRRIGVNPRSARLMVAKGDSMHDTISDGDLMIVDVSIREVISEGIYVLVYGGLVLLKRIQILRTGALILKSDNPRYGHEEVPAYEQPELIIEGRVKWAGGSV